MMKVIYHLVLSFCLFSAFPVLADKQAAANAVDAVMFDLDELGIEYVNFRVDKASNVSMTVDDTVPDSLYEKLLNRLRAHKDINSVLASQGPVCPIPYVRNNQQ